MLLRAFMVVAMMATLPGLAAERRGSLAFHYGGALTARQLEWFGKFDVLVTHDPLPAKQVAALRASGTKLALYEWTVAFYRTLVRPGTWQEKLLTGERRMLLNRRALRGHAGANDADAFYYDPANPEHTTGRVRAIAARLKAIGYDGVFFDTTTFESVHPDALAEYRKRHPDISYDAAFANFLAGLRRELRVIVTNQGYRAPEHYLPYADYDVTESLLTRPWHDAANRWNSVDFLMPELILKEAKRYPHVRFVHLNYLDKPSAERIETILATARLYEQEAFVALPDVTTTAFSNLYFIHLGRATSEIRRDGLTSTRDFECGTIIVTPERAKIARALP